MFIGETLRKIRVEKLLKQSFVATKLKISQSTYSNIENNITRVDEILLKKLSEILDISIEDLKKVSSKSLAKGNINEINQFEIDHLKEIITILKEEIAILQESLSITNTYNKVLLESKYRLEEHLIKLQESENQNKNTKK